MPFGPGGGIKGAILFKNAISIFKNTRFTNVGRALTKHPELIGFSITEGLMNVLRNPMAVNKAASEASKI